MAARGVLRTIEGGAFAFWCPGCGGMHAVDGGWTFNGDFDKPTFRPSVLVTGGHYLATFKPGDRCWCDFNREHPDKKSFECRRCHLFVTDGQLQFLTDSTHALAGKTVTMELPDHLK